MRFVPRNGASTDDIVRCELLDNIVRLVNERQPSSPTSSTVTQALDGDFESQDESASSTNTSPGSDPPSVQTGRQVGGPSGSSQRHSTSSNCAQGFEIQARQIRHVFSTRSNITQPIVLFEEARRCEISTGLRDENGVKHIFVETICWEHNFRIFDQGVPARSDISMGPYTDYMVFCRNERPASGIEELWADVVPRTPDTVPDWTDILTSLRHILRSYNVHGEVRPRRI